MTFSTDIKSIDYLKTNTKDLLNQVNDTHWPVIIIQNGEAKAVLQDPKSYEDMHKAMGLLKLIALGEEDIRKGNYRLQDREFEDLEKRIKRKNGK